MKKYIIILCLIIATISCSKEDVERFSSQRQLFFPNENGQDTVNISFSHYPGQNTVKVPFVLSLIGPTPSEDLEYKVSVVDSLTPAITGDYELPTSPIFRKERTSDTLWITLHKEKLEEKSYLLKIQIEGNSNFIAGYHDKQQAQLRYNNIISCPLWWDEVIETEYLGIYSKEKYDAFILVTGEVSLENKEPWEKRELCLQLKKAIEASLADDDPNNDIKEANGSPMIIPCY